MPEKEGVRAVTCPSCGARVHVTEGEFRTTCEYCGALLELPHPSMPEAQPTIIAQPTNLPQRTIEARSGNLARFTIGVAMVMLAAVGLVSYLIVRGLDSADLSGIAPAPSTLHVSMPAMIVPGADGADPDALVYAYDYAKDTRFLIYFDGSARTLRWQTAPLGDDSYRAALAGNDRLVFAVVKTRVMALDRATGQTVWEASVSDEMPYSCPQDCLRLMGQRVIVLARDGRLYGLDSQTGKVVWTIRLNTTPDHLIAVGDHIAIFDDREGSGILSIIDPMDGSEVQTLKSEMHRP